MGKVANRPALLPHRLVKQHQSSCKKKLCGLCSWSKDKAKWKACLQDPSWLHPAMVSGRKVKVGCSTCFLAAEKSGSADDNVWAQFQVNPRSLTIHALRRHEASKTHQNAAKAASDEKSLAHAPKAEEFKAVLTALRQGVSARQGGGTSDKKSRMRYSITEAILSEYRRKLRTCQSVAILRDERKSRLLVRFRACLDDMTVCAGVLGLGETSGTSESVNDVTLTALKSFCQPFTEQPRGTAEQSARHDEDLERRLRDKVTIIVTDCQASELLATEQLRGRRLRATDGLPLRLADLPNIKVVGRDMAHASTRLLKRPFAHDRSLESILEEYVSGAESFSQKVYHSSLLTSWWKEVVKNQDELEIFGTATGSKSLCAAKHRFNSLLRPLATICNNLQPMLALCQKVVAMRPGPESAWAASILKHFSAEKAVLLGMMADASATCLDLTRFSDQESMDVAKMNEEVEHFIRKARAQFCHKKVCDLPTYTKKILDTFHGMGKLPIIIGGLAREIRLTEGDVARALKTMQDRWRGHLKSSMLLFLVVEIIVQYFDTFKLKLFLHPFHC